jgi:hypothetical protein
MSARPHSPLPAPVPERRPLVAAAIAFAVGLAVLLYAVALAGGQEGGDRVARTTAAAAHTAAAPAKLAPSLPALHLGPLATARPDQPIGSTAHPVKRTVPMLSDATHINEQWESGFYPIYAEAARTFGVTWLLIASVHKQETAFSTAPTTYHGVNFANCCAGPMQFNVTNGTQTTWDRFKDAFRHGDRPAAYNHVSSKHPSVYDDFDSIMAGAALLRASGAGAALDGPAWQAAYDYYGHDATGVSYADEVLARAWGWRAHGFCVNCGVETSLIARAYADYGSYAMTQLAPPPAPAKKKKKSSGDVGKAHVVADQHHGVADHRHQP